MTSASSNVARHPAARPRGRNVIAVASGKGGVGKTFFSVTLAHALAHLGQRTLLFDGDLGLANIDIQLGLMPKHDLGAVIAGRVDLKTAVLPYNDGDFDIIAGRSGSGSLATLTISRLQALSDDVVALGRNYDRVLMDLGAGVDQAVRQMTANARTCLVLTTDEPTALTDAYAFIKLAHMARPNSDLRVVVNMAENLAAGKQVYTKLRKACEGFLKISPPLAGVVRRDTRVTECIRQQVPLMRRHPTCDAAEDIETIAKTLLKE